MVGFGAGAEHLTLWELHGSSHKDIWKVLFKSGKPCPDSATDRGFRLSHPASPVSRHHILVINIMPRRGYFF